MQVPGYILAHTSIKDSKMWQFYILLLIWASIYTIMDVSIVLFLDEAMGSIFLAGLALGIGSAFSMFFDGLFSYFQKIFTSRVLFLCSIIGMMISVILFFFPSIIFAFIATIFFSITYDLCDITAVSYILAKSLPAEYGQNLSYKQLFQGIGMLIGFIVSAILIKSSYFIGITASTVIDETTKFIDIQNQTKDFISDLFMMKVFVFILLIFSWFFSFILFNREVKKFDKEYIFTSFQKLESDTIDGLKHKAIEIKKNIPGLFSNKNKNQIELKSTENKEKFNIKELFSELVSAIKDFIIIFKVKPINYSLIWSIFVMCIFAYWDTFLGTFLPIFFTEVLKEQSGWIRGVPGSLLMLFFILPVLGFLPIVAKLGDKYGHHYFMIIGLILTSISVLIIGLLPLKLFSFIILGGFGIAIGYLFGMSSAKARSATNFNEFIAVEKNLSEIDSNASSGPLMLTENIGNILGPLFGGIIIAYFDFQGFFIVFGIFLLILIIFTFVKYKQITSNYYVFKTPETQIPVVNL